MGDAPPPAPGEVVFVGFWVCRGMPDEAAQRCLRGLSGCAVALTPERGNTLLGSFLYQGRMTGTPHHPMTPERRARLQEAAKHPNEEDFAKARAFAAEVLGRWGGG